MMRTSFCAAIAILSGVFTNAQQPVNVQFREIPASESGIHFSNTLKETPGLNIIAYEYFYNGGGVGLGDFNNDGLTDIYLTGNMQPARLYLNKGNMTFEDITAKAKVGGKKGWKTGVSIADVNADGFLDIYVCYSGPLEAEHRTNELFINNGNLTFTEKAKQMNVADAGYSTQAAIFDYDRDNDLDIFVLNHNNKNLRNFDASFVKKMIDADAGDRLYRNDNGKFTDVTTEAGIISNPLGYGLGVSVSDINNDGWPDLYVTNDYVEEDYLYINQRNGTFAEKLKEQAGHLSNFSMGCDIADINNDGWTDVFTLDMLPEDNKRQKLLYMPDNYELYNNTVNNGFYHQLMRNMLQLNNGNGTFSEIGQVSGVFCTDWSWASLLMDFDNDGYKDLFITNGYGRDMTNRDFVKFYANERLKYLRGEQSDNMFKMLQSIPVTPLHNYLYINNGNLGFSDVSETSGFSKENLSNGAACADLDNDGDLDLVINNLNAPAGLYRNMLVENGAKSRWAAFSFKGTGKNTSAIGASITLYLQKGAIRLENYPVRGFQSTMLAPLHTGLPEGAIDSGIVCWPDGKKQTVRNIQENTVNVITYAAENTDETPGITSIFQPASVNIPFKHKAPSTNDYKVQPLMPNMISYNGPRVAKGDVNRDGLEDLYMCGAKGNAGQLLIQKVDGSFVVSAQPAFEKDASSEDTDAAFFDADKDGDMDLYVVSGGYDFEENNPSLQDRLYFNTNGNFRKIEGVIPEEYFSGSCVKPADVDNDGDIDLFVGSRVIPGKYPEAPESFLLINDGRANFSKSTDTAFSTLGMITDAAWIDVNHDNFKDLITCGEWTNLQVLGNTKGKFSVYREAFADTLKGWWNRLHVADLDNDGDEDLVAGNWGLNSAIKVSNAEPATIYYGDFDKNGSVDPLICYYIKGKSYPMASRDEITDQMVSLRQKFPTYEPYSDVTINEILNEQQMQSAKKLSATFFQTAWFENIDGRFVTHHLPLAANFSPVYSITSADFNKDGNQDILLAGNVDQARIKIGKIDANYGTLFAGDGKGHFTYIPQLQSGLSVKGCTRDLILVNNKDHKKLIFAVNDQPLSIYTY